ncbi:cytochrome c [Roseiarcaceae bacterium H3SJ34-1]|uniref:c-type cytochrome n=1 Tax=Terripilifer ovatus TaxID=3032367 RepID=UPI003AB92C52|nr:cytochrome c [Roseiarcaceae bacterium H3SJ34-1]
MRKFWIAGGVLATAFAAAGSVMAQSELLQSTVLMRQQGTLVYRNLNSMVKGDAPYDQAKVDEILRDLGASAAKISAAFPASDKGKESQGSRYVASPKVWEARADFDAKAANMVKVMQDVQGKPKSLDQLKVAATAINGACDACHDTYRIRKN